MSHCLLLESSCFGQLISEIRRQFALTSPHHFPSLLKLKPPFSSGSARVYGLLEYILLRGYKAFFVCRSVCI